MLEYFPFAQGHSMLLEMTLEYDVWKSCISIFKCNFSTVCCTVRGIFSVK